MVCLSVDSAKPHDLRLSCVGIISVNGVGETPGALMFHEAGSIPFSTTFPSPEA